MSWDPFLDQQVDYENICSNGRGKPCDTLGYIRHLGHMFSPIVNAGMKQGLPVTANADIAGPVGGFGWLFTLNAGSPKSLKITEVEVDPAHVLLLSIPYPAGTTVTIKAKQTWCDTWGGYSCEATFTAASSIDEVRNSLGNKYYQDSNGVVTFRVFQLASYFTGNPNWLFPDYNTAGRWGDVVAVPRFERGGVLLPQASNGVYFQITANCNSSDGIHCTDSVPVYDPDVCDAGYEQLAYDRCCSTSNANVCTFANGDTTS